MMTNAGTSTARATDVVSDSMIDAASGVVSGAVPRGDELLEAIGALRREMNAVILAHYYQNADIQDVADFMGDSLQLAQAAARTDADVIVFCGVHFMAETAKILNPDKLVLLPDLKAGCSLADGCPAQEFKAFVEAHPGHKVISYINCSAEVKALSDVICTSSNAVKIVRQFGDDEPLIFAPDKHLGRYVMKQTGREMTLWDGSCIVHDQFSERKIAQLRVRYPEAKLIAHPECDDAVLRGADYVGSTTALLKYATSDDAMSYIVATEPGIIHQMQKARPEKTYIPAPPNANCACNECPYMRLNTLEKLYLCMRDRTPEITLPERVMREAKVPLDRMLAWS